MKRKNWKSSIDMELLIVVLWKRESKEEVELCNDPIGYI